MRLGLSSLTVREQAALLLHAAAARVDSPYYGQLLPLRPVCCALTLSLTACTNVCLGRLSAAGSVDAASVEACKSICEVGAPEPCVGINWVASQLPQKCAHASRVALAGCRQGRVLAVCLCLLRCNISGRLSACLRRRCMIQALGGAAQADIEKAIGAKFNWWWGSGTAKEDISKAIDHGNGDWTATAPCWAAAPNALERPGGLGWSFVLLVLLGFSVYVVLGAARQRVQGSTERWPHAEFWRELQALVRTLTTMLLVQSVCIAAIRRM
jgi:hypothetical protein